MNVAELIQQLQQIENKDQEVCVYDRISGDVSITNITNNYLPARNEPDKPRRAERRWITLRHRGW